MEDVGHGLLCLLWAHPSPDHLCLNQKEAEALWPKAGVGAKSLEGLLLVPVCGL